MPDKNNHLKNLLKKKSFMLFLTGQGVSNFGDAFQFIATTVLLVELTGSGLSAVLGIICSQVPSLFLSPFAGYLGDRFNEKNLCIAMDLLRGFVVIMFVGNYNTVQVYTLMLLLSMTDIVYGPARKKIIVNIIKEKELLMGNSLLMGISGFAYMIGPLLASILIGIWGPDIAFFINSLSFLFSALTILFVRMGASSGFTGSYSVRKTLSSIMLDIKDGFKYYKGVREIREFVMLGVIMGTAASSVNIAFFPYAFDTLRVTDAGWGLMMSIFYGTNLLAMFISIILNKRIAGGMKSFIYVSMLIASIIWFYYGMVKTYMLYCFYSLLKEPYWHLTAYLLGQNSRLLLIRPIWQG
jgi:MFS family permease